jgi:hypothetical protein
MTLDPDHHDPAEDAAARGPVPGWPTGPARPARGPVSGWSTGPAASVNHRERNARLIGIVVAVLTVAVFVNQPSSQRIWTWDPGVIIQSALIGATINGIIAYAVASLIGWLMARRH